MNEHEPVEFNSLDRSAEIEIRERNMPHWFQAGAATFVTFRTADSMPRKVLLRWQRELVDWLKQRNLPCDLANTIHQPLNSDRARLSERLGPRVFREFKRLNDRIFHRSLDQCHGECLLHNVQVAKIVADAIQFHAGAKYDLDSFVVMPNHVHAIAQFRSGSHDVVSQSWMRYTARQINQLLKRKGHFWQSEPFDHILRSAEQFRYLRGYIADNPKKAHLVPGEYIYWTRKL